MTSPFSLLLIEDDENQRATLAAILSARGYQVSQAGDCESGLSLLRDRPAPDAILLDWVLPGMSGWEFLTQLRKNPNLAATHVAVVSGYPERAEQASILSGVTFLAKPVDEQKLMRVLEEFVHQPPPQILLVDDEPAVGEVLAFGLRHHGLAVRQVTEGRQAVEVFRQQREHISLVLLDVMMPDLDGPATLAELREIDPRVKVVFMSGLTGEYSSDQLLACGALRVLQKPFPFMNKLAELLRHLATMPAQESAMPGEGG